MRRACKRAGKQQGTTWSPDVILFYLARWCQKETDEQAPSLDNFTAKEVAEMATKVAHNLKRDGTTVECLLQRDRTAWASLSQLLADCAAQHDPAEPEDDGQQACETVLAVLIAGTAPSQAEARLAEGPSGLRNEYVFTSPFEAWAKTIAKNTACDGHRASVARRRVREGVQQAGGTSLHGDESSIRPSILKAFTKLPQMLAAVDGLPPRQREVMVWTLSSGAIEPEVYARLAMLRPDMFPLEKHGLVTSDADIAAKLGPRVTAGNVGSNRTVARRKLADMDPEFVLLLDYFMPHRSTKPPPGDAGQAPPGTERG